MLQAILTYRLDLLLFTVLAVGGMAAVHLWLRRARGGAGVKPAAWCGLVALLIGGAVVTDFNADRARNRLRTTLLGFARTYAEELQRMGHARLSWDVAPDDPLYVEMIGAEKRWLRVNPYAADIYTFRHDPHGRIAFVVDAENDRDHDGRTEGEREAGKAVGEAVAGSDQYMEAALAGRAAFNDLPTTGRRRTWVSGYVPLYDDRGRVEGAVGVDYDAAGWSTLVLTHRGLVLGAAAALVGVLLASSATNGALRAEVERRTRAERALASSEERSRLIVESAPDAVVTTDAAGRITAWNARAEAIFGWPRAEALGRPLAETILPERHRREHSGRRARLDTMSPQATVVRVETHALRRSGEEFPAELSITRLPPSASGTPGADAVCKFIRDITDRKAAEAAVRQSEERFRVAATCATDSICEWDLATGRLSWFGDTGEHLGYRLGQFPETLDAWREMVHPDDRARVAEALDRHITGGAPFREEYRVIGPAGEVRHWASRGAAIRDAAGSARVMIAVVSDVTRERHTQSLEAERAALRKAVASMEQVLGVVAHELRTPLAGVRAISEFLLEADNRAGAEFDEFLRGLNREIVRMAETVNNLLEAARINSGRAKWNWSAFAVADVFEVALAGMRPLVDAGRVTLSCDVSPDDLSMSGDADAVGRLILNLLSNAVKHTEAGNITVTGREKVEGRVRWLEVRVCDTGEGIEPEILERLGEAFALNAGIVGAKHVKGAGLGLAICRGIVAAHGGRMNFESTPGAGTTVTVRLRSDLRAPATGERLSPTETPDTAETLPAAA